MRRGALWSLAAAVAGAAGAIVVTPEILRALGLADFGLYVLIVTVTSYAMYFDLGLPWAATWYFADDLARGRTTTLAARFYTSSGALLVIGVAAGATAMLAGPWLAHLAGAQTPPAFRLVVAVAAVSVVLSLQASLVQALLRALQQFDALGRVVLAVSLLLPAATFLAIRLEPSLMAAVSANLLVAAVALFLSLLAARRALPVTAAARWEHERLGEMVAFTGWSCAGRFAMLTVLHLDRVVVAILGSVAGLAPYAIATQFAARVNLLGGASTALVYSRASALHAEGRLAELRDQHQTLRRVLLCAALALTLPLVTLGPAFLEVWIGADMRTYASPILLILAAGHAIMSVTSIDAAVIEGAGRADLTAKTMAAWALIAIVAGIVLHPWFGASAIAAGVCLWLAGVGTTTIVLRRRFLALRSDGSRWRTAAGLAAAGVAALVLKRAVEPRMQDVPTAIAAMAASGAVVAALGLLIILRRHDREAIFRLSRTRDTALVSEAAAFHP